MLVLGIAFNSRSERIFFAIDIICLNLQTSECFFNPVQWRFTALLHRFNSLLKIRWFLTLLRNICDILLSRIDCCDQKATFAKLFMSLSRNYVSCHVNKCHHLNSWQPVCLPGRLNPGCIEYWILNIGMLASFFTFASHKIFIVRPLSCRSNHTVPSSFGVLVALHLLRLMTIMKIIYL